MDDTLSSMATEISSMNSNFLLWDKGQFIVLLSGTKLAKNKIFVGNKTDTLDLLLNILMKKSSWTDYMDQVLDIITLKDSNTNEEMLSQTMLQDDYPFRIYDISLPQCSTGFVYCLISIQRKSFIYREKTNCLQNKVRQHNSCFGSSSINNHL